MTSKSGLTRTDPRIDLIRFRAGSRRAEEENGADAQQQQCQRSQSPFRYRRDHTIARHRKGEWPRTRPDPAQGDPISAVDSIIAVKGKRDAAGQRRSDAGSGTTAHEYAMME